MRFALAALLVVAVAGTASATEYLWFEVAGGPAIVETQGPGEILKFEADLGDTINIAVHMSDDGEGLRGYGFDLYTDVDLTGATPAAGLVSEWTSVSAEVGAAGPGTIVELGAFTGGAYPTLGSDTLIATFDLVVGGFGDIGGVFNTTVSHGTSASVWGAYYNEAYAGATHFGSFGDWVHPMGHYQGTDFGTVITVTPEPAAMALLGLGVVALLRRR